MIAATEKRWAADALRDAKYNAAQAKRDYKQGNRALGRMHQREAEWSMYWYRKRMRLTKQSGK